MIRAVVWKEVREQGLIALTLMVLGAGILVAAAVLADPPSGTAGPADPLRYLGAGPLATLLLAVTAGTVCGGALFAAEREGGTIRFLESLPASRWQLWTAKMLAGIGLAAAQVGGVLLVSAALGLVTTPGWAFAVATYALLAFAWGAFGSTVARTTLGAVGVAIPTAAAAAVAFLLPVLLLFHNPGNSLPNAWGVLLFLTLMYATPVYLSAAAFTRADRERAGAPAAPPLVARLPGAAGAAAPARPHRPPFGLKGLAWLTARQLALPGPILAGFAAAFGLALLTPGVHPLLFWLPLSLAAGVLGGLTAFGPEQSSATARFWGEWRLPVGRAWAFKVAAHLLLTGLLLAVIAAPSVIRVQAGADDGRGPVRGPSALSGVFRSQLFDELGPQGWKLLVLPAAYGFAAGHLFGLLFRKVVVGAGVAALVGGTLAALWVPSLLAGGVAHWQVWAPPAVLLLTARLVIRAWAADRVAARGPVLALAGGGVAALALLAAGIAARVAEVPDEPDAEADVQFVEHELPPVDGVPGRLNVGREFRTAAERYVRAAERATADLDPQEGADRATLTDDRVERAARTGWAPDPELGAWLDRVFQQPAPPDLDWYGPAAAAAEPGQPVGIYEHPRLIGTGYTPQPLLHARRMGAALVARGLQRQAAGDQGAFPDLLRVALVLAANVRNDSVVIAWREGNGIERTALLAADSWLRALPAGHPGPLRQVAGVLAAADAAARSDPRRHLLAERYVLRERLKAPSGWLPDRLTPPGGDTDAASPEVDLVSFAWTVPWERERTRRLLGLGFEAGFDPDARAAAYGLIRGRPGAADLRARRSGVREMADRDKDLRAVRRAALLRAAVRLHRDEKGAPPAALADLVSAGCLSGVPADPYDEAGGPFRYRVSAGEDLLLPWASTRHGGPRPPAVRLAAGQPVLWSVGPNGTDDGGREPAEPGSGNRADDLVYPVPPPALNR